MSGAQRGATVAAWWPWLTLPAVAVSLVTSGVLLAVATDAPILRDPQAWVNPPLAIGFMTVAAGIWSSDPTGPLRRLGALYTLVGLGSAMVLPAQAWAWAAAPGTAGDLPGATTSAWLTSWVWSLGVAPLMGLGFLLYPEGSIPGRRWRPVLILGCVSPVVLCLAFALHPGPLENHPRILNPAGIGSARMFDVLASGALLGLVCAALLGLIALVLRFRAAPAGSALRGQIGGFLAASVLMMAVTALPEGENASYAWLWFVAGVALPLTVGLAVIRHGLLDQQTEADRLKQRLEQVSQQRRVLVTEREEERLQLRRELHDGLGPSLAAIGLGIRQLHISIEPGPSATAVDQLGDEVQRAVTEVRRICEGLRPAALNELGLKEALAAATDRIGSFGGPTITTNFGPLPVLSPAVEVAVFRIVMEATTNAVRHAVAEHVHITVAYADGVEMLIEDDGIGLGADAHPGVGLRAMSDRADELGGWVKAGASPAGGTHVRGWLPQVGVPR